VTTPRWTDDDLILAWHAGRDYLPPGVPEAADDLRHTRPLAPPAIPHEQRVADRVETFTRLADQIPQELADHTTRHSDHDTPVLTRCPPQPAYTTWQEVHAAVTSTVWRRVFYDLAPTTQAQLADQGIAPPDYDPTLLALLLLQQAGGDG
jgi:hypothetical protein